MTPCDEITALANIIAEMVEQTNEITDCRDKLLKIAAKLEGFNEKYLSQVAANACANPTYIPTMIVPENCCPE